MIPIVTIGLGEAERVVADRISGGRGVTHYDTVETAEFDMSDALDARLDYDSYGGPVEPEEAPAALDDDKWVCHVIYGEGAFGLAMTATLSNPAPIRLAHTGYTLALVPTLGEDPGRARRVRDGQVDSSADHRDVYSAVGLLGVRSFGAIDLLNDEGELTLKHQFDKHEADAELMAAETPEARAAAIARVADSVATKTANETASVIARAQRGAR